MKEFFEKTIKNKIKKTEKKNCWEIYDGAIKELDKITALSDVRSLSAVMFELSSIGKIKSRREYAKFFGANLREIKKIKDMLI